MYEERANWLVAKSVVDIRDPKQFLDIDSSILNELPFFVVIIQSETRTGNKEHVFS